MNSRKELAEQLSAWQRRIGSAHGVKYWRTLEEIAGTEEFQAVMRSEFPEQAADWAQPINRRRFLALMGASLALAGLSGCSIRPAPARRIVPAVRAPEEVVPGRPLFYATAMTMGGAAVGLLVESHLGRPTKVEGNPEHPASLGATDPYHQASVLSLYDPDRSQTVTHLGQTTTWDEALVALRAAVTASRSRRGAGLRILTETVVSPTLAAQLEELLRDLPEAAWHQYEPLAPDAAHRAALAAFGEPVNAVYDFGQADVILSLDSDFLTCGPGHLRYAADFVARRRVRTTVQDAGLATMNRLYVVETAVSNTGAKADHRLAVRNAEIERIARALAGRLGLGASAATSHERWLVAVARDLEQHRGRCLVLAGDRQPTSVHLLAHALNQRLGNVGHTVTYIAPSAARPVDQLASLGELVRAMEQGRVETLVILGGNPVYTAPADLRFAEHLVEVPRRFHLSLYQDETSRLCPWHLPEAHFLEAWSDTRAHDGTASIVQPLIEPLYQGRSAHEVLSAFGTNTSIPGYESVHNHWRQQYRGDNFEAFWQRSLHDGVVADTRFPVRTVSLRDGWQRELGPAPTMSADGYELVFQEDPTLYDGRFANNAWLQELPKPVSKVTWDNAAYMSPATARALDVSLGSYAHGGEHGGYYPDVIELRVGERTVRAPVWIMPGHADGVISVALGYGRSAAGRVGGTERQPVGFNAYALRTSRAPWAVFGVEIRKTGATALVACTQQHHLMENRDLVRSATLTEYQRDPTFARRADEHPPEPGAGRRPLTMYEPVEYPVRRWGMAIDLTACTGCNACVVACQAENNIPVVGKEQVAAGREMHWLRIDRYISGPYERPTEFHFQPVPCMHCEQAPCEYVCPTEATVHSADGLNDMIYQRCIGTRFCSNNCPYKVRRFNFFAYADFTTDSTRQQYNPDVTVRSRGVMEKCSYCVQRIRHAEIGAERERRAIADGEILTACQAACPARAIVFGDINDRQSTVRRWKDSPLHYGLLEELNTQPRTTYVAALRNPNPELEER